VNARLAAIDRFDARRVLTLMASALAATTLLRLVAIRYELPQPVEVVLVILALLATLPLGIFLTRVMNQRHTPRSRFDRPLTSGRFWGVMTIAFLILAQFVAGRIVLPRSWPTTIEGALAKLETTLDADARQRLAELGPYDLRFLHSSLGQWVADNFGLAHGNYRLHADCGFGDYIDPDSCTSLVIETFWKNLRAQLPAEERAALEVLESRMDAVIVAPFELKNASLTEVARFFNAAIAARLAASAAFTIAVVPQDARLRVTWKETRAIPLSDVLMRLGAETDISVRKVPPNLVLERDRSESD
jgi:hypothetical protein